VKRDNLTHPLLTGGGRVWVNVHPLGHFGIRLAGHHPAGVVELVAAVVHGDDVDEEDVLGTFIQTTDLHLEGWEHPSTYNQQSEINTIINYSRVLKLMSTFELHKMFVLRFNINFLFIFI